LAGIIGVVVTVMAALYSPHNHKNVKLDIPGKWNEGLGKSISMNLIVSHDWKRDKAINDYGVGAVYHTYIGQYTLEYRDHESVVLVFSTNYAGRDCWFCSPAISLFEFKGEEGGWKLVNTDISAISAGTHGRIGSNDVKIYVIGDNIYAVAINGAVTPQGSITAWTEFYARLGDQFRNVLSLHTLSDTHNIDDHTIKSRVGTYSFRVGPTGFYDVDVVEEVREGSRHVKYLLTYKFDGNEYSIFAPVTECTYLSETTKSVCKEIESDPPADDDSYANHRNDMAEAIGLD